MTMTCPLRSLCRCTNGSEATSLHYRNRTLRNRANNTSKSGTYNKQNTKTFRGIADQQVSVATDVTWQRQLNNTSSLLARNYASGQFGVELNECTTVSVLCLFWKAGIAWLTTGWTTVQMGFDFRLRYKIFSSLKRPNQLRGPANPLSNRWRGPEVDQSPPPTTASINP